MSLLIRLSCDVSLTVILGIYTESGAWVSSDWINLWTIDQQLLYLACDWLINQNVHHPVFWLAGSSLMDDGFWIELWLSLMIWFHSLGSPWSSNLSGHELLAWVTGHILWAWGSGHTELTVWQKCPNCLIVISLSMVSTLT